MFKILLAVCYEIEKPNMVTYGGIQRMKSYPSITMGYYLHACNFKREHGI